MYIDSIETSFTLSFDSWSTDRKTIGTQLKSQVDIGSAQSVSGPKNLILAHQTAVRKGVRNKANNVAVFDNLDGTKYHVDIDGVRYLGDGVSIDYASSDHVHQNRDLELIYKVCWRRTT